MTSYQNKYSGEGWNDCVPHRIASGGSSSLYSTSNSSLMSRKRSSKVIIRPVGLSPPPPASNSSRSTSATSLPDGRTGTVSSDDDGSLSEIDSGILVVHGAETPAATEQTGAGPISAADARKVLDNVLNRRSNLSPREHKHYTARLQNTVAALDQIHLDVIHNACQVLIQQNDGAQARDIVVQHSLVHSGVSSWILPLRKIIESAA